MRFLVIISVLFSSFSCFAQSGEINGVIIDTTGLLNDNPVTIVLMKDDAEIATTLAIGEGNFHFKEVKPGTYKIVLKRIGYRPEIKDKIVLAPGEELTIKIRYPECCLFHYPGNYKPHCPEDSSDAFIPIVYGFPSAKTLQQAKKGKVHLGGCMVTNCDPGYYCTVHKKVF